MNNTIIISRNGLPSVYYNRTNKEFVIDQARLVEDSIDVDSPFYFLHNEDTGNVERFVYERSDPDYDSEYMDGEPYEGYVYVPLNPKLVRAGVTLYIVDRAHSERERHFASR